MKFWDRFPCLQINWTAAVETLLKATGLSEEDRLSLLASELPVSLQCRDFLPELGALLSSTPSRYRKGVPSCYAILYYKRCFSQNDYKLSGLALRL